MANKTSSPQPYAVKRKDKSKNNDKKSNLAGSELERDSSNKSKKIQKDD